MIYCVRPAKTFLFNALNRKLKGISGDVGLDAASAGFKNRHMFKTDFYYGLDIDLDSLKKSVNKDNSNNTFGIYANMAKLDKIPDNSVDVIVSTNSLYHIVIDKRVDAINHLCRIIAPEGKMIIEISLDGDYGKSVEIMKNKFEKVKVIYFKNILSRFYEGLFEKNGNLGSHPIAGKKPFLALAFLISQLEYLTCKFSSLNKHAFIVCSDKKEKGEKQKFDLGHLPLIDGKIYNAHRED